VNVVLLGPQRQSFPATVACCTLNVLTKLGTISEAFIETRIRKRALCYPASLAGFHVCPCQTPCPLTFSPSQHARRGRLERVSGAKIKTPLAFLPASSAAATVITFSDRPSYARPPSRSPCSSRGARSSRG
jgi:hypothetical protein